MSLYYPPLTWERTAKIWDSHIQTAGLAGIEADRSGLKDYAREIFERQSQPAFGPVWNGRQTRNAFQSALALAGFHTPTGTTIQLERKFFKQVVTASDEFSKYVWRVKQGNTDADLAKMYMLRRDDYQGGEDPMNEMARRAAYGPFPQSSFGQLRRYETTAGRAMAGAPAPYMHMAGTMPALETPQFSQVPATQSRFQVQQQPQQQAFSGHLGQFINNQPGISMPQQPQSYQHPQQMGYAAVGQTILSDTLMGTVPQVMQQTQQTGALAPSAAAG